MILVTTDHVPGREIAEVIGVVKGYSMYGFATILSSFTDPMRIASMIEEARENEEIALAELETRAEDMEADAVVGLRFAPSFYENENALKHVAVCYGTAVKLV